MAGGFDEKAGGGGAQMGVMQGPMVSKSRGTYFHLLAIYFFILFTILFHGEIERIFFPFRKPQKNTWNNWSGPGG